MKKQEAIELMHKGIKITHNTFTNEEWMTQEGLIIFLEDGCKCDSEEFWSYRTDTVYDDGYSVWEEKKRSSKSSILMPHAIALSKVYEDSLILDQDEYYKYTPGTHGKVRDSKENPKINRNEPCPCGSGKKYKKCCNK